MDLPTQQVNQESQDRQVQQEEKNLKLFPTQKIFLVGLCLLVIASIVGAVIIVYKPFVKTGPALSPTPAKKVALKKFGSDQEFKDYVLKNQPSSAGFSLGSIALPSISRGVADSELKALGAPTANASPAVPDQRVSQTNVQVAGIDEPDIVKTDGTDIFLSAPGVTILPYVSNFDAIRGITPEENSKILPLNQTAPVASSSSGSAKAIVSPRPPILPPTVQGGVKVIEASPSALSKISSIDQAGDLLLADKNLVVLSGNIVTGFDVSDPAKPNQKWQMGLEAGTSLVSSRLYNNQLYLITQTAVNIQKLCPIQPLMIKGSAFPIPCSEIYYPNINTPVDLTYTVMQVNPSTGEIGQKVSFVGTSYASVVYMSAQAIYLTYPDQKDYPEFIYGFYKENGRDLVSGDILTRLDNLQRLDISTQAKLTEVQVILQKYRASLGADEALKFDTETQNRMQAYVKKYQRDFDKTQIVKVSVPDLKISSTGSVPGGPLNQFSLDEYQNNLRIATTVGQYLGSSETVNDVYVLDSNLNNLGQLLDLGAGERIYSARFIEDKGYLVTFKQTDPFFVLDLSNPKYPTKKGELKIPGYSSYLDPIAANKVLGVGQENFQVKLSLFDVSNPDNPQELDKYNMSDSWTEVSNNHHAFLKDDKHQIFFMPGSKGGYIFSYAGDKLTLKKAVADVVARRALYIGDFLYVIGDNKIEVLDENSWDVVKQLSL